ncbi:MAG: S9 family peptidase [Pseudomonadales bacterium]|nr:S9 family peptidase [Pseudomonadales bacterium]
MKLFILLLLSILSACSGEPEPASPRAERATLADPYAYLSIADNPATIEYMKAEQEHLLNVTKDWQRDIDTIAREINRDLPVTRQSPPVVFGEYEFSSEIVKGTQYPVYYRRHLDSGEREVLLDLNERAAGSDYYRLGGFSMSRDGTLLAFTEDLTGAGVFTLHVANLLTGGVQEIAQGVGASLGWNGGQVIYISGREVRAQKPGKDPGRKSVVLYEETDPGFALSVTSAGDTTLMLITESHTTTEVIRLLPDGRLQSIAGRIGGHRYRAKMVEDRLVILTNLNDPDYGIAFAEPGDTLEAWWFLDDASGLRINDYEPAYTGVFLHVREGARHGIAFVDYQDLTLQRLFMADIGQQLAFHTLAADGALRFWRRGLREPDSYWEIASDARLAMLLRDASPPGYEAGQFVTEQHWLPARDGEQIAVTLLYRTGLPLEERPLQVTAYGAYGREQDLRFDPNRLPLLRRDFILAWLHVRGGGELGAAWREAGRGLNKKHTFQDFQDATSGLVTLGIGAPEKLAGRFASAGGTIAGYIINESPELLSVITMRSPFVDIVGSLMDDSQVLTASDRLEWGDPSDPVYLDAQLAYSPYQQVGNGPGPDLLILAGNNDQSVPVHEALKWLAKLRYSHSGSALMLIDIQQNSGHLGATDQYLRRRQAALELVFIFKSLGIRI